MSRKTKSTEGELPAPFFITPLSHESHMPALELSRITVAGFALLVGMADFGNRARDMSLPEKKRNRAQEIYEKMYWGLTVLAPGGGDNADIISKEEAMDIFREYIMDGEFSSMSVFGEWRTCPALDFPTYPVTVVRVCIEI